MTDFDHDAPAYPIQWNAPAPSTVNAAWSGPSPKATSPAPTGDPRAAVTPVDAAVDESAAPVGWAAPVTAAQSARDDSQVSGFGWSDPDAEDVVRRPSGASRVDAADLDDRAPRTPQAVGAPQEPQVPQQAVEQPHVAQQPIEGGPAAAEPISYTPAPSGGQTGADAAYPPAGQRTTSPQVITQHDDLPEDSLTIGRSRDNGIVLDDMLVSRRHVVITADEEGLLLRDLGSRNGTFVNGRRVEQTHLHEGDRIGVGASTFEVRDGWLVSV